MTEHLSIEIINRYRSKTLTGKERFVADTHIANCSKCREQIGETEKLNSIFNTIQSTLTSITEQTIEHPDDEQLSDFINRKLNKVDTEIVTSHLAWCSICIGEVEEMETFGREFEPENRLGFKEKADKDGWPSLPKWLPVVLGTIRRPSVARMAQVLAVLMLMASACYFFLKLSDNTVQQTTTFTQDSTPTPQSVSFVSPSPTSSPSLPMPTGDGVNNSPPKPLSDDLTTWPGVLPAERQLLHIAFLNGSIEAANNFPVPKKRALLGDAREPFFALLSPAGQVIREDRPTLKWEPLADAVEYKVKVVDSTLGITLANHIVKGTDYKFDTPLEPGHTYIWQIVAQLKDDNVVYGRWLDSIRTQAEFKVLDTDDLKLVQDAEKSYQPDKDPTGYLALAVRYAKAGLIEDAERMLKAYLKERPASPQVVKMLNSLKRQSGSK